MHDRTRRILDLALPIVGGMVSQNVLNLVDVAMVGTYGPAAVAAVGIGGFANFLALAFITGLSSGVQAMSARRLGEGRASETAVPLNGALCLAIAMAVPVSLALYQVVPLVFPVLNPAPEVIDAGVPYLRARLVAMTAVGMNYSFRGYWNGVNQSRLYLRTLLIMHATNIALNWVFIFGNLGAPEMGAAGAGLASAIATYVGTAVYVSLGLRHAWSGGFLRGFPQWESIRTILRLSVPTGIQQLAFAGGYTVLFWIIGRLHMAAGEDATAEVAAANLLINITLVAVLPGIAFGLAAASLVGQALGRSDPEDAYRWGWDVVRVATVVLGTLGLPMLLAPDLILSAFMRDAETLELARAPLRLVGGSIALDAVGMVLMHGLLGAGANRAVMKVAVLLQWGVFLPVSYVVGPVLGGGLMSIWLAQVGFRLLLASAFTTIWVRRRWVHLEV